MRLDTVEARVVASLVEKQLTTPQQYPLTLNSLTLACNQSSNRDPVVNWSETEVQRGLDSLKQKGLVRFVLPSHGRSVVRYRHVLDEKLALDARQLALLAVLVLRGPQTAGELRARTERMARFDDTGEVEADLNGMTRGDDPLVVRLSRRPGQKEERWSQLLTGTGPDGPGPSAQEPPARPGWQPAVQEPAVQEPPGQEPSAQEPPGQERPGPAGIPEVREQLEALRAEVAMLRDEVLDLRLELAQVREGG